jgi:flagellum-specific peptidoglycan hydrolase FlgJ
MTYRGLHSIDLTKAMAARPFFQEKPKPVSLWVTLLVSNTFWFCFVVVLGGLTLSVMEVGKQVAARYIQEKAEMATLQAEKEKMLAERDMKIARLSQASTSTPADVMSMAQNIRKIFDSAQNARVEKFFESAVPEALRLQVQEGIPASAVLAQAIYESGYGQSSLARDYNNFFGMKAFDNWSGARAAAMPTKDRGVATTADFRAYKNLGEGFNGYVEFLKSSGRYTRAFEQRTGADFIRELLSAGYCPDADYLARIREIMDRHQLARLDQFWQESTAASLNKAANQS